MAQSLGKSTFREILAKKSFTQNFTRMYLELLEAKVESDQMSIDRATVDNVKAGHVGESLQKHKFMHYKKKDTIPANPQTNFSWMDGWRYFP